jgi:CHAD domain-containing protein
MKPRAIEGLDPHGPLMPNAGRIVSIRLDELRGLADTALAADASEAQHDLRIAAKRLRYVLEIFAPCLGEEAEAARSAAKRLQSVLGDLHDCDLMLAKVEQIGSVAALCANAATISSMTSSSSGRLRRARAPGQTSTPVSEYAPSFFRL